MMTTDDLVQMLVHLSASMPAVIKLLMAFSYLTGITFIIVAVLHMKHMGSGRSSREGSGMTLAYFVGGALLLFLPSTITAISNSTFGTSSILQYAPVKTIDIEGAMTLVVQTAGFIWFIRGIVLMVSASHPGVKHGPKGLVFLCAGILAMNFQVTIEVINTLLAKLTALGMKVKSGLGY